MIWVSTVCPDISVQKFRIIMVFFDNKTMAQTYMRLKVTKRPYGNFDIYVRKLHESGKIMVYAFIEITLFL